MQSFELAKLIMKSTSWFPKPTRYVLGHKLEEKSLQFLLLLNRLVGPSGIRFQAGEARRQILVQLSHNLDEFRVLLRMARETGAYSAGQYEEFNQRTQSVGRQLGGMLRESKEKS
ncbi:MAG: four helix bundle protein [Bdellovibrionaceae bacterium]|nr:four helix bundle protein [Pseudobdellovibrionaceae bacterium]